MVIEYSLTATVPEASETRTPNLYSPGCTGDPVIWPLLEFNDRPGGRDPVAIVHRYGARPPFAETVAV
jgi:hypothetical protein